MPTSFHDATDLIEALSQHGDAAVCTNTLDGDLAAWATLAAAQASSTAPSRQHPRRPDHPQVTKSTAY
jgi:hypothetical protein